MIDKLLDEIISREGVKDTNDPLDAGGRTKYGISEKYNPGAWVNGPPTLEEAKEIYFRKYIVNQNIHLIKPDYLMAQVADFGVHSGPGVAIQALQKIIGVEKDGVLGPMTLGELARRNPQVVNNSLVDARVLLLIRIAQKRQTDLKFLFGWVVRALGFRQG